MKKVVKRRASASVLLTAFGHRISDQLDYGVLSL
jgi:hypothetical protein